MVRTCCYNPHRVWSLCLLAIVRDMHFTDIILHLASMVCMVSRALYRSAAQYGLCCRSVSVDHNAAGPFTSMGIVEWTAVFVHNGTRALVVNTCQEITASLDAGC